MIRSPRKRPSLAALARVAEVSQATASRALNGHPALSAATVERVQRAARDLGYRSNPLLSSVMRQFRAAPGVASYGNIGYLTFGSPRGAWRRHLTYLAFFEGARDRAGELGFNLTEVWADQPGMTPVRLRAILKARGILGLVIGPAPGLPVVPDLAWKEFAPVKIGVPLPGLPLPCAVSNHYHAMQRVLEQLQELGIRRIGLVLEEHQNVKTSGLWLAPMTAHQEQMAKADRVAPLLLSTWRQADFARWFRRYRPEVIVGLRRGVIDWLAGLDRRVPEDVGFVHLDRGTEPGEFAGIDQRAATIGAAAVDLVVNRLLLNERGLPDTQRSLMIDGVWASGPTLRAPATSVDSAAHAPGRG